MQLGLHVVYALSITKSQTQFLSGLNEKNTVYSVYFTKPAYNIMYNTYETYVY